MVTWSSTPSLERKGLELMQTRLGSCPDHPMFFNVSRENWEDHIYVMYTTPTVSKGSPLDDLHHPSISIMARDISHFIIEVGNVSWENSYIILYITRYD